MIGALIVSSSITIRPAVVTIATRGKGGPAGTGAGVGVTAGVGVAVGVAVGVGAASVCATAGAAIRPSASIITRSIAFIASLPFAFSPMPCAAIR